MRPIFKLDEKNESIVFEIIETTLPKKKFKALFKNNVAML